jgi:hypothetical protein
MMVPPGLSDHGDANAVLYRAAGIDVVSLDVNLRLEALINAIEAHQRRAADGFQYVVAFHALLVRPGRAASERGGCAIICTV